MPAPSGEVSDLHLSLDRADEATLLRRYREGDLRCRELLARRYMPLARRLADRYHNTSEASEDLNQVAYVALLKAIDRFDSDAGRFQSYAISTMSGELKRHFRDKGWTLHVSRPLQERYLLVNRAIQRLTPILGRSPTVRELAEDLGLPLEGVADALVATAAYSPVALESPLSDEEAGGTLADTVGRSDPGFATVELATSVSPAFRRLPARERQIVYLRFIEDLTQSEIAGKVGVSQMHVSRLLRHALASLRGDLDEAADPSPEKVRQVG